MSFDRLARHYRWMEAVLAGGKLQRARTCWLSEVGTPDRALLVGEGNGRFLVPALRALPSTRFVCLDASLEMLRSARRSVPQRDLGRVEFVHQTLPGRVSDQEGFDLVATHFFLDCFPAGMLEGVMGNLAVRLKPGATWLIADFALPSHGLPRCRARIIHSLMYLFFRWVTRLPARSLVAPEPLMLRKGFVRLAHRDFDWGLIRSSLWRGP